MIFRIISLAIYVSLSQALHLLPTPSQFIEPSITKNQALTCILNCTDVANNAAVLPLVRIIKDESGQWVTLAELNQENNHIFNIPDVTAVSGYKYGDFRYGDFAYDSNTSLTIIWSLANNQTLGRYRCDLVKFDLGNEVVLYSSAEVIIEVVNANILLTDLQKCTRELGEAKHLIYTLTTPPVVSDRDDWPQGTYALLMPTTGCPNNTQNITWTTGYRKFHTESSNAINEDSVSNPSHLATPVKSREGGNNFMYQHFCIMKSRTDGPPWPKGNYCLQQLDYRCPDGLENGEISIDEEDVNYAGSASEDFTHTIRDHTIYYCCRADSPHSTPISLPTSTPFYLFKYNGECQMVQNANFTVEYMILDSEDENNSDYYINDVHPDGHLDNAKIEFCYYQPSHPAQQDLQLEEFP